MVANENLVGEKFFSGLATTNWEIISTAGSRHCDDAVHRLLMGATLMGKL